MGLQELPKLARRQFHRNDETPARLDHQLRANRLQEDRGDLPLEVAADLGIDAHAALEKAVLGDDQGLRSLVLDRHHALDLASVRELRCREC